MRATETELYALDNLFREFRDVVAIAVAKHYTDKPVRSIPLEPIPCTEYAEKVLELLGLKMPIGVHRQSRRSGEEEHANH